MDKLRNIVSTILEKADALLNGEPARMIGYGAAVAIVFAVQVLNYIRPGLLPAVSFEESVGLAFAALAVTITVIESIRRFVYSPQTYVEDLFDEWQNGHDVAHLEESLVAKYEAAQAEATPTKNKVPVAPAPKGTN